MDLGSPIGMLVAVAAILAGIMILGGNIMDFIDPASIMLVVIPPLGALFAAFPLKLMLKMPKHFGILLGKQKYDPIHYVNIMVELAEKARSQGLLALESEADNIEDPFIKNAALMIADAMDPETVEDRLYSVLDAMTLRHSQAWAIYDKGASFAPAFGMLATVISLVNMLMNLDFADAGGVASLGVNMSAALITTFYGSLMANAFFLPIATKLRGVHQKEIDCKKIVVVGILTIQKGVNPKMVKEMFLERLDPQYAAKFADGSN